MRGGKMGTPSSPHSVDKGRGGTRGMTTLGLGGGTGTPGSRGESALTFVCSSVFLVVPVFHANLPSDVFLGDVVGELEDSNFSMSDVTFRFVCAALGVEVGVPMSAFFSILFLSMKLSVLFERRLMSTLSVTVSGGGPSPLLSSSSEPSPSSPHPSVGRGGLGGAVLFLARSSAEPATWPPLTMEAVRGGTGGMEKAASSSESLSDESITE